MSDSILQRSTQVKCICDEWFCLGRCVLKTSLLPVCKCVTSLTTLSQMLQSLWGWCCWMRLPPPRETLAREEVSRADCFHLFSSYCHFLFIFKLQCFNYGTLSVKLLSGVSADWVCLYGHVRVLTFLHGTVIRATLLLGESLSLHHPVCMHLCFKRKFCW